jgi:hypothetical protein
MKNQEYITSLNIKPVGWKSGRVFHDYADMATGYEPLYTLTDVLKLLNNKIEGEQYDSTSKDIDM